MVQLTASDDLYDVQVVDVEDTGSWFCCLLLMVMIGIIEGVVVRFTYPSHSFSISNTVITFHFGDLDIS